MTSHFRRDHTLTGLTASSSPLPPRPYDNTGIDVFHPKVNDSYPIFFSAERKAAFTTFTTVSRPKAQSPSQPSNIFALTSSASVQNAIVMREQEIKVESGNSVIAVEAEDAEEPTVRQSSSIP